LVERSSNAALPSLVPAAWGSRVLWRVLEARFDKGEGDTGCIFRATIQTSREARERLTFGEGEGRGETGERYLAPEAVKAEA